MRVHKNGGRVLKNDGFLSPNKKFFLVVFL